MVYLKDNLRYQNVLSKKYCRNYNELSTCFEEFEKEIKDNQIDIKGPFFVSMNDFKEDGPVDIELFAPVYSSSIKIPQEMSFHSYYGVERMASSVVKENIDKNVLPHLYMINATVRAIGCKVTSPIYFVYENLFNQGYITIKMAYSKDREIDNQKVKNN